LHLKSPTFFTKDRASRFTWANGCSHGSILKQANNHALNLKIDVISFQSAACPGAVFDLVPTLFPLPAPLDDTAACLANLLDLSHVAEIAFAVFRPELIAPSMEAVVV
jgi:hypothetical protein